MEIERTMHDQAHEALAGLSPGKRELLEMLLRQSKAGRPRLSFAQKRLWFLDQLEPGRAFYNIASFLRIEGHLDLGALERSLNEVVRRHEILRTTFTAE